MMSSLSIWKTNRAICRDLMSKYSVEQLNIVPPGFGNNLIWNIGHIIIVQQRMIYAASGLPINIPEELIGDYKSGTKPSTTDSEERVALLSELLVSVIPQTIADAENGVFGEAYKGFTTATSFSVMSVGDAIAFNTFHEGLHLGAMQAIRRFL